MNGLVILAIYAVIMIAATLIFTKKEKNVERFCVGNRRENWIMSALSIAATWIWAPALFVSTEKAYTNGFVGLFWFLAPNVLCLIIFIPFAKKIRAEMPEGITLSGYMRDKYQSDGVKRVYLFQLIGLSVLSTGVQLLEPMKAIVKELMREGKTVQEIGKQLGMKPEEIFRLSDFSKEDFLNMMTNGVTGFSNAEYVTKI